MSRANQNNKSFHKWHQIWRQMLQMKRKANERSQWLARLSEVKRRTHAGTHTPTRTQAACQAVVEGESAWYL